MKNPFQKSPSEDYLSKYLAEKAIRIGDQGDYLTRGEIHQGLLLTGTNGSGKTTGPGADIFLQILKKGDGGMIQCIKSDASQQILNIIKKAGREKDVIHFKDGSPYQFNLLKPWLEGEGGLDVISLTHLIMEIYRQIRSFKSLRGHTDSTDAYWDDQREILVSRIITTLHLAEEPINMRQIRRLLSNRFTSKDVNAYKNLRRMTRDPKLGKAQRETQWKKYESWMKENYFLYCYEKIRLREDLNEQQQDALELIKEYWMLDWPSLASRTQSIIVSSMMALLEPFINPGILTRHFSSDFSAELNLENCYKEGKIILVDWPPETYKLSGAVATALMKYAFQSAIENRKVLTEEKPKSCFLYIDEYQTVISPKQDVHFQGIARSSMVSTIYITQSINSIIAAMGSIMPETKAKSLMNNLATKIFCANADETNDYASSIIGEEYQEVASTQVDADKQVLRNYNLQIRPKVSKDHYTRLKTGGSEAGYRVETIIFKTGKQWRSGKNYLEATFKQIF